MIDSLLMWLGDPLMGKTVGAWLAFFAVVIALLALDLGVFNRKDHVIGVRESLKLSVFYIAVAVAYGVWVWFHFGPEPGTLFFTAYLVEKSLSVDNIFVMSLIFTSFAVPPKYQHRVLFWGIVGVIVLRGVMIGLGTAIVTQFHWVLYLFGAFLVFTGIKMMFSGEEVPEDPSQTRMVRLFRKILPVSNRLHGHDFFVREARQKNGRVIVKVTPLFLALLTIEFTDVVFAVDSVPAVLAITTDPFLVYTSNIFAILGLRSLYFALSAIIDRFSYLKYALAAVLVFIGGKIFWTELFGKVDPMISLGVTFLLLTAGVVVSLLRSQTPKES